MHMSRQLLWSHLRSRRRSFGSRSRCFRCSHHNHYFDSDLPCHVEVSESFPFVFVLQTNMRHFPVVAGNVNTKMQWLEVPSSDTLAEVK